MYNSNLTDALKTFSKQELKEFSLFIQSPFYNTNQSVIKLFEQLKKLHPEFDSKQSNKKFLFEKAFGKIQYNDSFMRMTTHRLMELLKEFLVAVNLKNNDLFRDTILLDELNNRELDVLLSKSISDLDKKEKKLIARDAGSYYIKYMLEYYKNDIRSRDTSMITYKDILDKDLVLEQKYMNINFFINSLKFFQYFLNQKNFVVNTEGYPDLTNEILDYLENNPVYLEEPELNVYYKLVRLLISKNEKYFDELYVKLLNNSDDLNTNTKYNLIAILRNFTHIKVQQGDASYTEKAFAVLKFSLDHNIITILPSSKYMSETRFMNVVWTGLFLKKHEFIETFIEKYISRIEPDKRQYVLAYNLARLEFEKGNFNEALKQIGQTGQIKNVMYKAAVKQLYIMIYYELKMFQPALDQNEAYRHFANTDKLLPEIYKTQCITFVNYFKRLLHLAESPDSKKIVVQKLIDDLKPTTLQWLKNKADQL